MSSLISVHDLAKNLPDGTLLFRNFNFNLGKEKVGIIGKNGIGKSTLLRILAGEMEYSAGSIVIEGKLSYLPQKIQDFSKFSIAQILNVEKKLNALQKADIGKATLDDLHEIDDDWDFMTHLQAILKSLELEDIDLQRLGESISGGELMHFLYARLLLENPDIILFDEPTNNLDSAGKNHFYKALSSSRLGYLIVSHDRELLNKMDRIFEISNLGLRTYQGNYDFYLEERNKENEAALHKVTFAEERLKKQVKMEHVLLEKQEKRNVQGKKNIPNLGLPKIVLGRMKENAQNTTSRLKDIHADKTMEYSEAVQREKAELRDEYRIKIDIKKSNIPSTKEMIMCQNLNYRFSNANHSLWKENINFAVIGNKRVHLTGRNGSGKSTLLKLITQQIFPTVGDIKIGSLKFALLDQGTSFLHDELSILENLQKFAMEHFVEHELRVKAGRFLFYGDSVFKKVKYLSGGERVRLALACLLAMNNAPDIFILDEPTNNLDIESIEILTECLNKFSGVLFVVSHDKNFISDIKINMTISL
ncbi:ABC-F family ATP-binding cassette domain-containing protein [Fluviispira vulneris]|uniref:ABC-F family ATP-binding cassette domain-containing protein n=1 Tax=Fluviispira vulneris TaxID=2763012 RepID=UPI001643FFAB|nr:ABC-F family ATP-binding cassette domain-containing protein [Fluviispira vulneris]